MSDGSGLMVAPDVRRASMSVCIQPDDYGAGDSSSPRWAAALEEAGREVRWVDVRRADILDQLRGADGFMWRFGHCKEMTQIARRLLPVLETVLRLQVYPDQRTCWHYDDKVAQALLFDALRIPTPRTWVWYDFDEARRWATAHADYPVILKLASGAGSQNVRLVRDAREACRWLEALFWRGAASLEPIEVSRRRRFVQAWRRLAGTDEYRTPHHGYALFQEFLPGNEFDTRVTVIGERAFAFRRRNRPGDFRASGSGLLDHDPSAIDPRFVRLAFAVAQRIGMHSCAMDGLYRNGEPVVGEVSYTYVSSAVASCPGHWRLTGDPRVGSLHWVDGQLWPEQAQVQDYLQRLRTRHAPDV